MTGIKDLGIDGEKDVCRILRKMGYPVRKSDGHCLINDCFLLIEAKNKSRYWEAPPFDGQGIDKDQFDHYLELFVKWKIRTLLFVPGKEDGWVWNYIDELNNGLKHITPSDLVVFPFENLHSLDRLQQIPLPPRGRMEQLDDESLEALTR